MGSIWHWLGFMGGGVIGGWPSCNWVLELEKQHRVSHKTMMLSMVQDSETEKAWSRSGFDDVWRFIRCASTGIAWSVYFARGKRLAGCQTADMR